VLPASSCAIFTFRFWKNSTLIKSLRACTTPHPRHIHMIMTGMHRDVDFSTL
jgi:hypothetical protein